MAGRFSVDAIFRAIDKMTAPIAKMQSGLERFSKAASAGIKGLDVAADKWLGTMSKVGVGMSVMAAGAGAALAAAAKPGMEFEQQIANLGAAYLKTRKEIKPLEDMALKLGAATQFSATDIAGAMEAMAKAGFEEEDALAGIEGMTYAAAAAGEDLVTTSGNIGMVMKAMGIPISETAKVADLLALASVKTASSIGSLTESMAKVGPTARQLGVPLKDAVAMVASLQDAGLDASEAGSATATMLTMMSKPTDAMRVKMRQLGISFADTAGNMKSPALVLGELVKAGKGAGGNMKQLAFFADLVGLRGQKAAINLSKLFESGDYQELTTALDSALGTSKKMADLRMNTLTGDLDKMTESLKTVAIDAYSVQSGGLRGITTGMTEWIDKNRELIGQNLNAFFKLIADNFESIVTWGRRIGTIVAVITAAALAVKVWAGYLWLLNAAMLANPISLIAIAIVGAIALILAFWPEISAFFSDMWAGIVSIAQSVGSVFADIGSAIADGVSAVFGPIFDLYMAYWRGLAEFVTGVFVLAFGYIWTALKPLFDWIAPKAKAVFDFLLAYWTTVWELISGVLQAQFDIIVSVVEISFGIISGIAQGAFDFVSLLWGGLIAVFSAVWDGIKWAFEKTLGPVFDKLAWAVEKIREVGRFALGSDEESGSADGAPMSVAPQVVSPGERLSQSISESTTTNKSEVTIKDQTGRAVVTKKPARGGAGLRVAPSGGFH